MTSINALGVAKTISRLCSCNQKDVIHLLLYHTYNWNKINPVFEVPLFDDDFVAIPKRDYPVVLSVLENWDKNYLAVSPASPEILIDMEGTIAGLLTVGNANNLISLNEDKRGMMLVIEQCPVWRAAKEEADKTDTPIILDSKLMNDSFLEFYSRG